MNARQLKAILQEMDLDVKGKKHTLIERLLAAGATRPSISDGDLKVYGQSKERGEKTHGHGAAFADLDRNWHTDLLLNPGGFALCDTLLAKTWGRMYECEERGDPGVCDSREQPVVYLRSAHHRDKQARLTAELENQKAAVLLKGTRSNRDAVGAHVELLPDPKAGVGRRKAKHYWVHNANGFQSQNSAWITLPRGSSDEARLRITWPRGHVSTATVKAWSRTVVEEPLDPVAAAAQQWTLRPRRRCVPPSTSTGRVCSKRRVQDDGCLCV